MARTKADPLIVALREIIRALCRILREFSPSKSKIIYQKFKNCDHEESGSNSLPTDVPKGYCAVYVGSQHLRFVIPATYLNHSLFRDLLRKAEQEFGFDHQDGGGGLVLPCDEVYFCEIAEALTRSRRNGLKKTSGRRVSSCFQIQPNFGSKFLLKSY